MRVYRRSRGKHVEAWAADVTREHHVTGVSHTIEILDSCARRTGDDPPS
jgi:hypothetical protein